MERKLTAILAADIVGYSKMIRADEEGTLAAFRALRDAVISPLIEHHRGRVVKYMGDGLLVDFASIVDAVSCAVALQEALLVRNADHAQPITFRIGVNLGDVVIDGADIQGDGVNIAARLEGLARPGGVCLSGLAYDQVRDRLGLPFAHLGAKTLKNIDRAVDVWEWTAGATHAAARGTPYAAGRKKPSIAVLPFDNMSGDPEQAYFADGIAEDVITALSRARELLVIARNSSFSYRGQSVDIRQVGRDLGVTYVALGSVRRAGNRVRITAQLIEAESGTHLWAERYDRPLEDIFDVQDEMTVNISGAVGSEIRDTEKRRARASAPEDLSAWETLLKANWYVEQVTPEGMATGIALAHEVLETYGDNSDAYATIAYARGWQSIYGWGELGPMGAIDAAIEAARRAIALDARNDMAHCALCAASWLAGKHDAAIRAGQAAIALNPNAAYGLCWLACAQGWGGAETRPDAIAHAHFASRLVPQGPLAAYPLVVLSMCALLDGRYAEAIGHAHDTLRHLPTYGLAHRILAASLALDGQTDAAREAWGEAMRVHPQDMGVYMQAVRRVFGTREDADRYIEGMRLAGAEIPA